MAQYNSSEITNIFWASNEGFKGGRDPLGIQNSSIATYSKLIPGLTNLTSHIRYYSLYCWLLSEYDKFKEEKSTTLHQYNFIRRAELAMALIMKDMGVGAVVGAMFVFQGRYKLKEEGVYDIADGADYESKEKYWTFKSGALGQYYLGSLIYYGLVKIEENRFYLRDRGKELADAVRDSIGDNIRQLFLECILSGTLKEEDREKLKDLAICSIKVGSSEWNYLNNLLIKKDGNSSFRRETIFLLLSDIKKGVKIQDFIKNRFLNVAEYSDMNATFGWYFYYLCECLHYSIDLFFCLILDKIYELHNPPMEILSQEIRKSIMNVIMKDENCTSQISLSEWKNGIIEGIDIVYDRLRENVKKQDYVLAGVCAMKLMLRLCTEYEDEEIRKSIEEFEKENDLKRQRGIFIQGITSYVQKYLSYSISDFIEMLIEQIMQEHIVVAIAKMGKNNSDLRKFIFEDGRVVLVEQRYPVETSPRINSLFNFLKDMGYIDFQNELTEIAENFINNYGKE